MTDSPKTRQYFYSVGKRKNAIARVKVYQEGAGDIVVNDQKLKEYFAGVCRENAVAPLALVGAEKTFDVEVFVQGGGKCAQSDAMRHGISRALLLHNPDFRSLLKPEGFLRRDARKKERKKPGLKRARRAPQWNKR